MLTVKGMGPLVRIHLPIPDCRPFTYRRGLDIELGLQSFRSTPTSLEFPEREEVIATSAPSANPAGEVPESDHMIVSVQRPELQPALPTTVDAETGLSPALVQEAWIDSNEVPGVRTENAQSAITDVERQELHPAANDHL